MKTKTARKVAKAKPKATRAKPKGKRTRIDEEPPARPTHCDLCGRELVQASRGRPRWYCDGQPGSGATSCRKMASALRGWYRYQDGIGWPATPEGLRHIAMFREGVRELAEHLEYRQKAVRSQIDRPTEVSSSQVTMFPMAH